LGRERKIEKESILKLRQEFQKMRADATKNHFTIDADSIYSTNNNRETETGLNAEDLYPSSKTKVYDQNQQHAPSSFKPKLKHFLPEDVVGTRYATTTNPGPKTELLKQLEQRAENAFNRGTTNNNHERTYTQSPQSSSASFNLPLYQKPTTKSIDINSQQRSTNNAGTLNVSQNMRDYNAPRVLDQSHQSVTFAASNKNNDDTSNVTKTGAPTTRFRTNSNQYSNVHPGLKEGFKEEDSLSSRNLNPHLTFSLDSYDSEMKNAAAANIIGHDDSNMNIHDSHGQTEGQTIAQSPFPGMGSNKKKERIRFVDLPPNADFGSRQEQNNDNAYPKQFLIPTEV